MTICSALLILGIGGIVTAIWVAGRDIPPRLPECCISSDYRSAKTSMFRLDTSEDIICKKLGVCFYFRNSSMTGIVTSGFCTGSSIVSVLRSFVFARASCHGAGPLKSTSEASFSNCAYFTLPANPSRCRCLKGQANTCT